MKRFKDVKNIIKKLYTEYGEITEMAFDELLSRWGESVPFYSAVYDGEKVSREYILVSVIAIGRNGQMNIYKLNHDKCIKGPVGEEVTKIADEIKQQLQQKLSLLAPVKDIRIVVVLTQRSNSEVKTYYTYVQ